MIFGGLTSNDSKANTPLDLAEKIVELREQHSIDNATICKRLNITDQTIRDVLLLANAPTGLHKLIRDKVVSSTLAIEEIRAHGAENALERLTTAASNAKASGKAKITKRVLDKSTAAKKITELQAAQLLHALEAVLHDPVFGKLSPGTITSVHVALTPHVSLVDLPQKTKGHARTLPSRGSAR